MAGRLGRILNVTIYEPRDFSARGPGSCNMCGGIVSESLLQAMAADGLRLPAGVIQRRIDSYVLHMDVGSVRIETPLREKRIASVYRGGGPRDGKGPDCESLDAHLLDLALERGACRVRERVTGVRLVNGRPVVTTDRGSETSFDLLAVATGVNTAALKLFEDLGIGYAAPRTERAFVCEFHLGREMVERYLGSSMHVFLLDLERLDFAAIIPKSNYATVCLIGEDVDSRLVHAFLDSREVRQCLPPHWRPPDDFCRCTPRLAVGTRGEPFADRLVFLGDCGVTRLYKDGIGAAFRAAKAAAVTAVFRGVTAADFRRKYLPVCRGMARDNRLGRLVFAVTRGIQHRRIGRQALRRMVSGEQRAVGGTKRMSSALWDTFTGSAPYRSVLARTMHPLFVGRLMWEAAAGLREKETGPHTRRRGMASGATGAVGKRYGDGEAVYRQGDRGDGMYVIMDGHVEVIRREGDAEFCLATLGPGDFFGEMGLFAEDVRSASVRAVGAVTVFTLEKASLLQRIHEDPSLAFRIIQKMSERIRDLETSLIRRANAPE